MTHNTKRLLNGLGRRQKSPAARCYCKVVRLISIASWKNHAWKLLPQFARNIKTPYIPVRGQAGQKDAFILLVY